MNTSSDYFNNKCYSSTSGSGTDITLNDRKTEFVEGNQTICQENCQFSEYNGNDKIANCSCKVKEASAYFDNMTIDKIKLYENFGSENNNAVSNLGITSCNVLSSTENIESNAGFYLLLIILAIFIVIFIIFCSKGYNLLENKFDEVIYNKFDKENKKKKRKKKIHNTILNPPIKQTGKIKNLKLNNYTKKFPLLK